MAGQSVELASAYISLVPSLRGAGKHIDAGLSSSEISNVTQKRGKSLGGKLMSGLGMAAKVGGAAVGALLVTAIGKGFGRLKNIENAQASLKGLGHDATSVEAIMKNAMASVKGTAFGMDEAAKVAASSVAAGIKPGKALEHNLKLVGDAATIGGTSLGEMGAIFNKVASSNKIQGDTLAQLSDKGIPIIQLLSKELGVSAEETVALASKGKINFATFQKAMENGMGGAALKSADTFSGALANTGAALSRFGAALLSGIFPSMRGSMVGITELIDMATEAIGPFAKTVGEWIGGKLEKFIAWIPTGFKLAAGSIEAFRMAWKYNDGDITSSGFNGYMERAGYLTRQAFEFGRQAVSAFTAAWEYNDGEVTSSGFNGFMERAGFFMRRLWDAIKMLDFSSVQNFFKSVGPAAGSLGPVFERIGGSLVTLQPAFAAFADQLPAMSGAVTKVASAGLQVIANVLGFLASHVDTIIKMMPFIVAGFVAWRVAQSALAQGTLSMQAAQLAMTPVITLNNILRLTAIRLENQQTKALVASTIATGQNTAATNMGILGKARYAIALGVSKAGLIGQTIATKAAAVAQRALNAVLNMNPIMKIVALIGILVGAVVWLYKNNETARKIIDGAWNGIKFAVKFAWENVIKPAFNAINGFIKNTLGPVFTWIWKTIVEPVWKGISGIIKIQWAAIKIIFDVIKWTIKNVLGPAFNLIYNAYVKPVWNKIKPIFETLGKFLSKTVAPGFKKGVDAIGKAFNGLRNVARVPINFVLGTVYNDGIKWAFDKVAGAVGSKTRLPKANLIPAFAKGGLHRGGLALVGEEGPEIIDTKNPGRVYTAKHTAAALRAARGMDDEELRAHAGRTPEEATLPMGGNVWDWLKGTKVGKAVTGAVDWVRGSMAELAGKMLNPVKSAIQSNMGGNMLGDMAGGAATKAIDSVIGWIKGKDNEGGGEFGGTYNGPNGSFARPSRGPITSRFGPRWGGHHAGTDIAGGGPTFAALNGVVKRTGWNILGGRTGIGILLEHAKKIFTYYGHNPSMGALRVKPGDVVKAGQHIGAQGATGNVTGTHLHFEVHQGRLNGLRDPQKFFGFDKGGWLQPGITPTFNGTTKPEPVFTGNQWEILKGNIGKGGGGDTFNVDISLNVSDLKELREIEDFFNEIRRRTRQKVGAR